MLTNVPWGAKSPMVENHCHIEYIWYLSAITLTHFISSFLVKLEHAALRAFSFSALF